MSRWSILTIDIDAVVGCVALPRTMSGGARLRQDGLVYGAGREVDVALDKLPFISLGDDFTVEGGCCVKHDGQCVPCGL